MSHTGHEGRQVAAKTQEELEDEHYKKIVEARIKLYKHLESAQGHIRRAEREMFKLTRGRLADPEYDGGTQAGNYLLESEAKLRICRGILPTDEKGELVNSVQREALLALLRNAR